jgi:uncharacterized Zn finger protein
MAFWSFPRYVCKAEKQAKAAKKLEQLKKKRDVKPVILQGSAIARTWWGKAWNRNLERYADYSNRIGRGRSYVRHGAVLDLLINPGEVRALVHGSRSRPYEIVITIKKMNKNVWHAVTAECGGMLDSLQELLAGNFPASLGDIFMQQDAGLFPGPKEITFECSCPDWADMCKHVAASLYGVGARLDEDPSLFFTLRGVDVGELIARSVTKNAERLIVTASQKSSRILENVDLSGMFGIELAEGADSPGRTPGREPRAGSVRKTTAPGKKKTAGRGAEKKSATKKAVSGKRAAFSKKGAAKKRKKKSTRGALKH